MAGAVGLVAQNRRDFSVSARKYSFTVSGADGAEIRVAQDDLVTITFSAEDIPHSFTILGNNPYRIDRRAEPGKPVTLRLPRRHARDVRHRLQPHDRSALPA